MIMTFYILALPLSQYLMARCVNIQCTSVRSVRYVGCQLTGDLWLSYTNCTFGVLSEKNVLTRKPDTPAGLQSECSQIKW